MGVARAIYRILLRALPQDMRIRFGPEMEELLERRLAAAGTARSRVRTWLAAYADLAWQATVLRFRERDETSTRPGSWLQDLRLATRGVRASRSVSLTVVLTLALGIGASTATFSVVYGVLLEKLPFEEPDRLVFVWPEVNANKAMALLAEDRMPSLQAVSGLSNWTLTLTGVGQPRQIEALLVSPGYFEILGVRPRLGRVFRPGEDLPGAAGVVVLSHDFWVSAFGADPNVLERTVELSGAEYDRRRVIGVMPPDVDTFWEDVDVWVPLEGDPALGLDADDSWYVNERVARLATGVSLEQANREVLRYAEEVQTSIPDHFSPDEAQQATVRPVQAYLTRQVGDAVWAAFATVCLVLLIGCFNVTNLLLARGDRRREELAVRSALGASRARVTRMLMAETAALGVIGGVIGVALAFALVRWVVRLAPESFPGIDAVSVDLAVLGFALGCTAVAILVSGLVPAIRAGRVDARASVGGRARGATRGSSSRLTSFLVTAQVALAVVVTIGSGLMVRSLATLLAVDPGIRGEGVLTFRATPPGGRYPDGESFRAYYDEVSDRVARLPFVEAVGGIHLLPGTSSNWMFPVHPEGFEVEAGAPTPSVNFRAVRGDYFAVTDIEPITGRLLGNDDRPDSEPVVLVNESFASRFWDGQSALGKTLSIFSATGTRYRVVGVVPDVHQHDRDMEPLPEMYFSHAQVPWDQMSMWVVARLRPDTDPERVAPLIHDAVWSVDPDVPITGTAHLAEVLDESVRATRLLTLILSAFGMLALGLCAVGVFSVTAYTCGRRRPEFGVRVALGSSRASILRVSLGRTLAPVAAGLTVGIAAASVASRGLASVLFGVGTSDPPAFVAATVILGLTALMAASLPAWSASRVDPVTVLGEA